MKRQFMELTPIGEAFDPIPWQMLGIFPPDEEPHEYNWFNYTVGATEADVWDAWCPVASIEGSKADNSLIAWVLNGLVCGLRLGELCFGDDVVVPLGVPDGDDVDCVFWIGEPVPRNPESRMACYQSSATLIVPVKWSSGLGWKS